MYIETSSDIGTVGAVNDSVDQRHTTVFFRIVLNNIVVSRRSIILVERERN